MPDPYREAQLAARARQLAIEARQAQLIQQALDRFAGQLVGDKASQRVLAAARRQLEASVTAAVQQGRDVAFQDLLGIWQDASKQVAATKGVPGALLGAVRSPPVTMLGAFESVGGPAHWKTLVQVDARAAAEEAAAIVREGLAAGIGQDELAMRLRRYVKGSEPFRDTFGDRIDLRRIPAQYRDQARQMDHNARRIAFSEVGNARHEAEVQMFTADPLVAAVKWTLSPNRGTLTRPDECDYLAVTDWFGLGPGIYPVARVPPKPHPWDRCELLPVTRGVDEAKARKLDPSANPGLVSPNAHPPDIAAIDRRWGRKDPAFSRTRERVWRQAQVLARQADGLPQRVREAKRVAVQGQRQAAAQASVQGRAPRTVEDFVEQLHGFVRREQVALKAEARAAELRERADGLLKESFAWNRRMSQAQLLKDGQLVQAIHAKQLELGEGISTLRHRAKLQDIRAYRLREKHLDAQRAVFAQPSGTRGELGTAVDWSEFGAKDFRRQRWAKAGDWLDRVVHRRWTGTIDQVSVKGMQGHRSQHSGFGPRTTVEMADVADPGTFAHEMGHALECANPEMNRAALEFRARRVVGEDAPQPLRFIYPDRHFDDWEVAFRDKFRDAYSAKVYGYTYRNGTTPTEIISMGLEYLYRNPVKFWLEDPDYFRFIVDLLVEARVP